MYLARFYNRGENLINTPFKINVFTFSPLPLFTVAWKRGCNNPKACRTYPYFFQTKINIV